MAKYSGVDFIDFDSQLNDEEKLVRQTAREFVENEIVPIIEKHSREATFPMHLVPQLGELGFFGASLHGYGCAGMSSVAYGLMTQELERGDSGIRSFASVQSSLCMYPIYAYGSEEQRQRWLPDMAPAVRQTFVRIYQEAASTTAEEAEAWVDRIERETGRYVSDVFA